LVNNVETLVNVLDIVSEGGAAFARTGTPDSTGRRLFCLSGHVRRPGVYEVPMGTTLRALMELAGGVAEGRKLQAVLLGGAAGSFVTEGQLDVPLTFEGTRAIGATLGSGAVMVLDDTADLEAILLRIARFFRHESCGQCVPCRVGTKRQEEILHRLLVDRETSNHDGDIALLADIAQAMRDASICGLGQTAASAIQSAVIQLKVLDG
jgi:NADH-quinone oxidoreductase subunit F